MNIRLLAVALVCAACSHRVPLYCDENTPCTDPTRPFCDVAGEFPASEGISNTCIPDPTQDAGVDDSEEDAAPPRSPIKQITTGATHTCALLDSGSVRCWGTNSKGQLGYGHTNTVGDNEHPYTAGDVPVGGLVRQIAAGNNHTCALLESGGIRCWGEGTNGRLGYASTENIGDNETPLEFDTDVSVGGLARQVVAGDDFTCVLLESGTVRCWGSRGVGVLGPGAPPDVGDDETPASRDPIDIGVPVDELVAGQDHVCARTSGGGLRCWGHNIFGTSGYPTDQHVGDDEQPSTMGDVNVGGSVAELALNGYQTCARLSNGAVRCWGRFALLNYGGGQEDIGDNEVPATAGDVPLGRDAVALAAAFGVKCALLDNQAVRCWGSPDLTGLGDDSPTTVEPPQNYPTLPIDRPVVKLPEYSGSGNHMCVVVDTGGVRCWGIGSFGALGYANTEDIGDEEPVQNVEVQILDP